VLVSEGDTFSKRQISDAGIKQPYLKTAASEIRRFFIMLRYSYLCNDESNHVSEPFRVNRLKSGAAVF